ncbi:MAG: tyrosine--tRNA ligase [Calditrichaeota bacterium]|jgi:tyrosyl-tRNA synthetase|nr:tyrosine--tRNA ligase [Calditrichota bacterium]MBT7787850.1 tyrosine--tRNA ligase [Calditrichota bacterium]
MSNIFPTVQEQLARLKESVEPTEIVSEDELAVRLDKARSANRPLRVKQGFDASSPDLHIGHGVSIWKLKTFQDLGHQVVFVIGDFTAMIGDPSGKSKTRPVLTREQVEENARTYHSQVFKILDPDKTEIRFNSEWHGKRNIYDFLELCSHHTVRRMLERDDFWKRFNAELPITMLEFLYPLLQAYDSVALKADVEVGGSDQKFNLVLGRHIQRAYGQDPQLLFLMPLMRGTDGNEKMSKSLGNTIGLIDEPGDMYGKIMSISDDLLKEYYTFASGSGATEIEAALSSDDPYKIKHDLAKIIVSRYHTGVDGDALENEFLSRFRDKGLPTIEELVESGNIVKAENDVEWLPRLISSAGAAKSNGEANRLIKSGAVSINGEKITGKDSLDVKIEKPLIIKVGKRRFFLVYTSEEQLRQKS